VNDLQAAACRVMGWITHKAIQEIQKLPPGEGDLQTEMTLAFSFAPDNPFRDAAELRQVFQEAVKASSKDMWQRIWDQIKNGAGRDPRWPNRWVYPFCSIGRMDDPDGSKLRRFTKDAQDQGFEVVSGTSPEDSYLYVLGPIGS